MLSKYAKKNEGQDWENQFNLEEINGDKNQGYLNKLTEEDDVFDFKFQQPSGGNFGFDDQDNEYGN